MLDTRSRHQPISMFCYFTETADAGPSTRVQSCSIRPSLSGSFQHHVLRAHPCRHLADSPFFQAE